MTRIERPRFAWWMNRDIKPKTYAEQPTTLRSSRCTIDVVAVPVASAVDES